MVGDTITAVTYNIRVGYGGGLGAAPALLRYLPEDLGPVIAALGSLDPDVAGLQEVLGEDQAARIARALGMHYAYAPHPAAHNAWWGVAVLSKFPIRGCRTRTISRGLGDAKTALACTVGTEDRALTVLSVHKDRDVGDGSATRRAIAFANEFVNVILAGDFNLPPDDPRYDMLRTAFFDTALVETESAAWARAAGTYGDWFAKRIDYIFVRAGEFDPIDAGLAASAHDTASDHRAYYAKLKWKGGGQAGGGAEEKP